MHDNVIEKLQEINLRFYQQFANSFVKSRTASEPGLERIISSITKGNRVLDLGCGHGRIAALIPEETIYTGMDFSFEMLSEAKRTIHPSNITSTFVLGNLTDTRWPTSVTHTRYDWIFLRAVLQHIPSYLLRSQIVKQAAALLSVNGILIMANWQFLRVKRLQKRILPWHKVGIDIKDVEPGDYLLDWQREGYGIRYVHLVDEEETKLLAQDAGLVLNSGFYADGHNNNLTLYALMTRQANKKISVAANGKDNQFT